MTIRLTVDGDLAMLYPNPDPFGNPVQPVSIVSLERAYDAPSSLALVWNIDWRLRPYAADVPVELWIDEVLVFSGLLDLPRPVVSVQGYPGVEYKAYDLRRALRGPVVLQEGDQAISLQPGPLQTVVNAYLNQAGTVLQNYGVSSTVDYVGGAENIHTFPLTLEGNSVDEAFQRMAANAPGVRLLLLPDPAGEELPRYTFINIFSAPVYELVVDERFIETIDIQQSIDGCAGAVRTLQGQTNGRIDDVPLEKVTNLYPAWDPALEKTWCGLYAFQRDAQGKTTDLGKVYRVFEYEADDIPEKSPLMALVESMPGDGDNEAIWQQVAIWAVDREKKQVLLNQPAIKYLGGFRGGRMNALEWGRVRVAPVKLRYSTSFTGTARIIINSRRYPETGFAGRAYQLAPITCGHEKIISIPGGVDSAQYVQQAWAAYSEPMASGEIPVSGDLPAELWRLGKRISLATDSHGSTGFEDLAAPLMGIRVDFEGGRRAILQLQIDKTQLLSGGSN